MSDTPDLVALVYGVAEQRAEFDELVSALMPMIRGDSVLPPEVALQLSTALIEIEDHAAMEDELYGLVNEQGAAALALSEAGQILTLNTTASELFSISTGDGLSALNISRTEFERFRRRVATYSGTTLVKAFRRAREGQNIPILMYAVYNHRYRSFVLTALSQAWPDSVDQAMGELFELSRSEREILSLLARGINSEAIAKQRFRAPATVRQQIKSIMQKMGVSSQLEAAALAATAAATAAAVEAATGGDTAGGEVGVAPALESDAPLRFGTIFRGKRRVGWRRFGVPSGRTVLLLHGPSFGAGEYPADRRAAMRYGLDVYAIERPGYGRTDVPPRTEDVLECQCRDILALFKQEKLERVSVLAHEVGLIPALELAHHHGERVKAILAVSAAPPFREMEQIDAMPVHQGVFIQAARHAPWLARLMVRLLMVRTRRLGPERWTEVIFQGLEPDSRVIRRESLRPGVIGTYSFYLNQMGAGFEVDLKVMLRDWGPLVVDPGVPLVLLQGGKNPTTPPAALKAFRDLNPRIPMEIVENAGLTLAIAEPELIYRRLCGLTDP